MDHHLSPTGAQVLIDAQLADQYSGVLFLGGLCARVTIAVQGIGTTSSGVLTIEEAYYPIPTTPYSGTWSTLTTVNASDVTGGKQQIVHLTGSFWAVRARISTVIGGTGTLTVVGWGN